MFGIRKSPHLSECTDFAIWAQLVIGTTIVGLINFAGIRNNTPAWFAAPISLFSLVCLFFWWRERLIELAARRKGRKP